MTETKRIQRPDGRKARTRQALISAASRLFAEQGVERTTVDEIAEAAGVSVGSLYVHFGSKDSLLLTLIDEALDVNDHYMSRAAQAGSALERVLTAGAWYYRFAMEQTIAFRFVAMRIVESDATPAQIEATRQIARRVERIVTQITTDLQQAMVDGEIDTIPIDEAMVFLWGTWNGVAGLVLRQDDLAIQEDLGDRALERGGAVLIKGLGGDPSRYEHLEYGPPKRV